MKCPKCKNDFTGVIYGPNTCPYCGTTTPASCSALSGVETLAFLVDETSEDAVFCFLSAISAFGIETMENAQQVFLGDADVRRWVEASYRLIPKQNTKADRSES